HQRVAVQRVGMHLGVGPAEAGCCQQGKTQCQSAHPERYFLQPQISFLQAAEKGFVSFERLEKHTSGAEAHVDLIGFMPGINPRPTARTSFSAACQFSRPETYRPTQFSVAM